MKFGGEWFNHDKEEKPKIGELEQKPEDGLEVDPIVEAVKAKIVLHKLPEGVDLERSTRAFQKGAEIIKAVSSQTSRHAERNYNQLLSTLTAEDVVGRILDSEQGDWFQKPAYYSALARSLMHLLPEF